MDSQFKKKVYKVVNLIPEGKVVSYGQIALYVGMPRAAREVGWVLNQLDEKTSVPWWRVVNNKGRISIKGSRYSAYDQRRLLEQEGIEVNDDLTFDINKYRFLPDPIFIQKLELDPVYLEMISDKIPYRKNQY
jgi:methylated-DNA-protein-cysteine methyltransferase-like protein